jgi:type I restriction enzyme S subunit
VKLKKLDVILPPLALQREFATFVAKVDKLAFAARRRRDVAKQLYRAKIQEYFG